MRRQDMQATKLMYYALRLGTGAVIRRLGYLLELYAIVPEGQLARKAVVAIPRMCSNGTTASGGF